MTSLPLPKLEEAYIVLTIYRDRTCFHSVERQENWIRCPTEIIGRSLEALDSIDEFWALVIEGWSSMPPVSISTNIGVRKSIDKCLVSVRIETEILLKLLSGAGRVVHCITGSMMSIFNVSNHLSDSGSICIDPVSA
ncbi:hypothetical protein Tco_0151252 [Tanacetum coccineum]